MLYYELCTHIKRPPEDLRFNPFALMLKKRSQSVNVKHRKISFADFQTETIGISVKKILIEVP